MWMNGQLLRHSRTGKIIIIENSEPWDDGTYYFARSMTKDGKLSKTQIGITPSSVKGYEAIGTLPSAHA